MRARLLVAALCFGLALEAGAGEWETELGSDQTSSQLGYSVASAGDVDGDGVDDPIVGSMFTDSAAIDAGAAWVYLPEPGGAGAWGTGIALLLGLRCRRSRGPDR